MKRVKFWSRVVREKSVEWVLVEGDDPSQVPLKAWKAFNKSFWEWKTSGKLFPLDELEASQVAAREMVRAAERVAETKAKGEGEGVVLTRASLTTYLVSAAFKNLLKFKERTVDPTRSAYRTLFAKCRVAASAEGEARGEDKGDREWSAANSSSLDVQAFAEALPGLHSASRVEAMRLAAVCVEETLAKLDADAQAGLRAWLKSDGIWVDAARIYNPNGSVQGYVYRFKCLWAPAFKEACAWRW